MDEWGRGEVGLTKMLLNEEGYEWEKREPRREMRNERKKKNI